MKRPPLWRCPKCRKTFVTRNIWHSCRRYELGPLFERCEPQVRRLFDRICQLARTHGPVILNPGRRGIALQVRVRALGVVPKRQHLEVGFAFRRVRPHRRFFRIQTYAREFHAHWVRVASEQDLDGQFRRWLREAYRRAAQE